LYDPEILAFEHEAAQTIASPRPRINTDSVRLNIDVVED
jgi:hypothetical protein